MKRDLKKYSDAQAALAQQSLSTRVILGKLVANGLYPPSAAVQSLLSNLSGVALFPLTQ